jgi:antirestriction protein ArdC
MKMCIIHVTNKQVKLSYAEMHEWIAGKQAKELIGNVNHGQSHYLG